jgi:hypothetical protein
MPNPTFSDHELLEREVARAIHARIVANVDRMYAETDPSLPAGDRAAAHERFSARQRELWTEAQREGVDDLVHALIRDSETQEERDARMMRTILAPRGGAR